MSAECNKRIDAIFKKNAKVKSGYRGDVDALKVYRGEGNIPGKTTYVTWANLPRISYSAKPETLYNMTQLEKDLAKEPCFLKSTVEENQNAPIQYPKTFYAGIAVALFAVLYSVK